jgi:uncharacterized protein YecE (DUF72 family)
MARPSRNRLGPVHIGTSGWTYDIWKDLLYAGVPRTRWLQHYASVFNAVEVNASFYHRLKESTFAKWHDETPDAFRFTIKANRYLTHVQRLAFPSRSLNEERDRSAPLGDKLAVVLWQLPAGWHLDLTRLKRFLDRLVKWPSPRHALEFRHTSWFTPEVASLLGAHRVAAVQSDAADWPMWDAVTTDLVYVRLHGHKATYSSRYSSRELAGWVCKVAAWRGEGREIHVYFDNTDAGHAPENAAQLAALASRAR